MTDDEYLEKLRAITHITEENAAEFEPPNLRKYKAAGSRGPGSVPAVWYEKMTGISWAAAVERGQKNDAELYKLDMSDPSGFYWQKIDVAGGAAAPSARWHHTATMSGGTMIVFGGFSGSKTYRYYNDVWLLDTASDKWSQPAAAQEFAYLAPTMCRSVGVLNTAIDEFTGIATTEAYLPCATASLTQHSATTTGSEGEGRWW